jgi:hypothetical protein
MLSEPSSYFITSGNVIVISGACLFTIGLVWGGVTFPWNSAHVLAPLCVGAVALVIFIIYEYKWSPQPLVRLILPEECRGLIF